MRIEKLDSFERVPISDATRILLCDFASGDVTEPLHHLAADWEEVFHGVCRNGLLGLTHRYLEHWKQADYPPPEFRQWIQEAHRFSALSQAVMYRNIRSVLAQLVHTGVDFIVLKGPAVAHLVYPHPSLRSFNDLDLMVRERNWSAIHRVLIDLGFEPENDVPQAPPKLVSQATTFEMKYYHPQTKLTVEVHYDDLLIAGLVSRNLEGFWQRAIRVDVAGVLVKVLALEDQLLHLCTHTHYHAYSRLNWFSDIAFIIRDHAAQLNWERLIETVRIEEVQVGVYYTLYFLEQMIGISVPETVLASLRPDPFRRWIHERYLPEEKVLSLQPIPRPFVGFYFFPLFKRLIPDMLVMGRRRDKIRYLLRLLLPPQAWLRNYYRLDNTHNIAVHYLLHPLKLTHHYLAEAATKGLSLKG